MAGKNSYSVLSAEREPAALALMREMGIVELNRNPENNFAVVEQSAFETSNVAPGIGFSPKINKPRCPLHSACPRDGVMRSDGNTGGPVEYPAVKERPLKINGAARGLRLPRR